VGIGRERMTNALFTPPLPIVVIIIIIIICWSNETVVIYTVNKSPKKFYYEISNPSVPAS
jgi:hypothetical protein